MRVTSNVPFNGVREWISCLTIKIHGIRTNNNIYGGILYSRMSFAVYSNLRLRFGSKYSFFMFSKNQKLINLYSIRDDSSQKCKIRFRMNAKSIDARVIQMPAHDKHSRQTSKIARAKITNGGIVVVNELLMRAFVRTEFGCSTTHKTTNYPMCDTEY